MIWKTLLDYLHRKATRDKNKASKPAAYALKADALMWKAKVLGGGEQDLRSAIEMIENVEA